VLVGGEEVDLAGESVFVSLEAGTLFAGLGSGSGGAVGFAGELRVVLSDGLGHGSLYVKHFLEPLITEEHGDIGMEGRGGCMRLKGKGRYIFQICD
jgi:hypothetical protein